MCRPVIHTTDLYHPHGDPDDHFDLALQFALHMRGATRLLRILLDHPSRNGTGQYAPDVIATAQLNAITGAEVPYSIGCRQGVRGQDDGLLDQPWQERSGVDAVIRALEEAESQVRIVIVGDCSDIAAAAASNRSLFEKKCAGVYVNAGTGRLAGRSEREWNVRLNPAAFSAMFHLPCRMMWCPCFHEIPPEPDYFGPNNEGENGSVFCFPQKFLFEKMGTRLKRYFSYMFECSQDPMWLEYLERPAVSEQMEQEMLLERRFYSTASILHAAGMAVEPDGSLTTLEAADRPVYSFVPIRAVCNAQGDTQWEYAAEETGQYILRTCDRASYSQAVGRAMGTLLQTLDQ